MIVRIARVKVGNRQAPSSQKPHPQKVGFLRLRAGIARQKTPELSDFFSRKEKSVDDACLLPTAGSNSA